MLVWFSVPNATTTTSIFRSVRRGTLSSPSNRVNSYDPDDGQLSVLKTPVKTVPAFLRGVVRVGAGGAIVPTVFEDIYIVEHEILEIALMGQRGEKLWQISKKLHPRS